MHKESYRNLRQNSTPGHVTPQSVRVRVNKEAIKLAAARDRDLSKHCHCLLAVLLLLAGGRDDLDVSDDAVSALMSSEDPDNGVSPASVRGLLARLEAGGYIEVARKRKGRPERHIELRDPMRTRKTLETQETGTRSQAHKNERENCAGPTQNPSSREETQDKETPNARAKRAASDSESLKSESLSPEPPTLAELMDEGRAEAVRRQAHFCEGRCAIVVNTAQSLNDAEGAPHYEVYYHQHAGEDNDLWLKALCQAHKYQAQDRIEGPTTRHYFEKIVLEFGKKKTASEAQRQRQAEAEQRAEDAARKAQEAVDNARVAPSQSLTVDDPDLDQRIAEDPFADDDRPVADGILAEDQVEQPQVQYHPAVVAAQRDLNLPVALDLLQSVFDGAYGGRAALWALGVAMLMQGYTHAKAYLLKIADDHRDKDDAYCLDRAKGIDVAERTKRLKKFEVHLEAEKQALNRAISFLGEFRSDSLNDMKSLVGGIMDHVAKTAKPAENLPPFLAAVTLPTTSQGRSVLEEAMGAVRDEYQHADLLVKDQARAAGVALANAKCFQAQAEAAEGGKMKSQADLDRDRESWRRVGVYHAYLALRQPSIRAENVGCAQTVDQVTDSLGEEPHPRSVFIDPDEEEYTYVP